MDKTDHLGKGICIAFHKVFFILILICTLLFSCESFLDVGNPPDKVTAPYVYGNNSAAIAVLSGLYYDLQSDGGFAQGRSGIGFRVGLSGDEFYTPENSIYKNAYSNNSYPDFWGKLYNFVYRANAAIEGLSEATLLKPGIKRQLLGEALFMRAFCYFYLINLYGDVPLLVTSDYQTNSVEPRTSKELVYIQIITDLLEAKNNLSESFLGSDGESLVNERTRPSKWAASALLARVYLYTEKWDDAEREASETISKKELFSLPPLREVFLKNSMEAVWQLQQKSADGVFLHVRDAELYILVNGAPNTFSNPVTVSHFLLERFERNDGRKSEWLKLDSSTGNEFTYFYKYKIRNVDSPVDEYLMVFRIAEQYLIRAEAKAQRGKLAEAQSDLNAVRERAGLPAFSGITREGVVSAILNERQVELFTEWGHRWFDLKRMGEIDNVMNVVCPQKGGNWKPYKRVYPIPVSELQFNSNLKQNEGYPSL